ncbi:hypothetical protein AVEN_169942-1 [Araneus ventricosus]|uniref:Uncharacterized protein n=1 Tax=Araneus ventricosus TaxID=182803 RepID=A0A4Y2A4P9_ARAVE|nr:hypothetical protein AVEN_236104-1 [Araneus ventricosus]GBL74781.1 hypothetical protein AVEN_117297-1 [Araneus ventricosus]GBL74800.1 hypothetical protein AVEN_169942-1 [Araneus ventricosus]
MNIIEDIRDALLHAVENRSPPPRTPMDLWTVLKDEWCELPPRYLQTLVEFMSHRVAALRLSFHFEATRELFGDRPSNFEQSPFARMIPEPTLLPKLSHHSSESLEPMTLPPGHMCSKLWLVIRD